MWKENQLFFFLAWIPRLSPFMKSYRAESSMGHLDNYLPLSETKSLTAVEETLMT